MSPRRSTDDRRAAALPCASNIAGTCSTCSPSADDLLGHLLTHLLNWSNCRRTSSDKSLIDHGKLQTTPVARAVEKSIYLQKQVGAGESATNIIATLRAASVPCALFFARPNPHSVAMLRNIC